MELIIQVSSCSPIRVRVIDFPFSYLAEMDPRIEILVFKFVYIKNFALFGDSERELWRFENFVFPIHLYGISAAVKTFYYIENICIAFLMNFSLSLQMFCKSI
jgi:hypothetical protein